MSKVNVDSSFSEEILDYGLAVLSKGAGPLFHSPIKNPPKLRRKDGGELILFSEKHQDLIGALESSGYTVIIEEHLEVGADVNGQKHLPSFVVAVSEDSRTAYIL